MLSLYIVFTAWYPGIDCALFYYVISLHVADCMCHESTYHYAASDYYGREIEMRLLLLDHHCDVMHRFLAYIKRIPSDE